MWQIRQVIFLLSTLIIFTSSLHLHQVTDNYITYLKNQQSDIKKTLDSLKDKIQKDYNSIADQNDIDKKIQQLQKSLKQQRLLISEISLQTVNQQLNSSQWTCPVLPQQVKKQILDDSNNIDKDLKDIDGILAPLDLAKTQQPLDQAKKNIKDAEKTNDALKKAIDSKGQQLEPSAIHPDKKTNLNSPNWVLDGKKIDQLNDQYKKAAESGALQICPIEEPYYSSKQNKCIKCDKQDAAYFSLRTGECLQCYNYDKNQHRCKDHQGSKTNFPLTQDKLIIPQGKSFDDYKNKQDDPNKVPCPNNAPFFTGQQCIQCQKYFDLQTKKCKKCQNNNSYDSKTHICKMQQKIITNIDAGKPNLIIPNDKTINDIAKDNQKLEEDFKVSACPKQKPYFNDYECVQCLEGTYFSLVQKSCSTCQAETHFNKQTNHCQKQSFYTNLEDPNWSSIKPFSDVKKQIQQKAKDPLYGKCPLDKPFSIGKQCIQCTKDQHFTLDKLKCEKCFNGQYFNKNLHNCTYSQTNYQTNPETTPNLIFEGRPKNEWMYMYYKNIQNNEGMTDCPKQKPFFDGSSCIICPQEHLFFNLQYKMCQKCYQNTKYNNDHHECLTTQGNIASQVPTLQKMAAGNICLIYFTIFIFILNLYISLWKILKNQVKCNKLFQFYIIEFLFLLNYLIDCQIQIIIFNVNQNKNTFKRFNYKFNYNNSYNNSQFLRILNQLITVLQIQFNRFQIFNHKVTQSLFYYAQIFLHFGKTIYFFMNFRLGIFFSIFLKFYIYFKALDPYLCSIFPEYILLCLLQKSFQLKISKITYPKCSILTLLKI